MTSFKIKQAQQTNIVTATKYPNCRQVEINEVKSFLNWLSENKPRAGCRFSGQWLVLSTSKGNLIVHPEDWIVNAGNQEFSVWKAAEFEKYYEPCEINSGALQPPARAVKKKTPIMPKRKKK